MRLGYDGGTVYELLAGVEFRECHRLSSRSSRTTIGFPLYWRFAEGNHTSQLIGNVYYSEQRVRQGVDWQVHIFPLLSFGATPDGHWWNVLYGLAGYERRGSMTRLKTFWIPIPLSE